MTSSSLPAGPSVIDLRAFVRALLAEFEVGAKSRHVTLDGLVFADDLEADPELLQRLLKALLRDALRRAPVCPTLPTLLMSASNEHELIPQQLLPRESRVLQKPFTITELLAQLQDLLVSRRCPPRRDRSGRSERRWAFAAGS